MNLDDDLAAWAAAARLPDAQADAIFRAITVTRPAAVTSPVTSPVASGRHVLAATSPGLSPAFWRRHAAGFAAGMVAATAPVRYAA